MAFSPITSWQIEGEKHGNSDRLYFLGLQNHCSCEIKGLLLLERKATTNLDSILKSKDIILPTKFHIVKAMIFSSHPCMDGGLDHKEGWEPKNWRLQLWCWRRLLRVSWTARRSHQSILEEINPEYSLEGLMLKLKLQYFGHLMQRANSLEKNPDAGKDWKQKKKMAEDEMIW